MTSSADEIRRQQRRDDTVGLSLSSRCTERDSEHSDHRCEDWSCSRLWQTVPTNSVADAGTGDGNIARCELNPKDTEHAHNETVQSKKGTVLEHPWDLYGDRGSVPRTNFVVDAANDASCCGNADIRVDGNGATGFDAILEDLKELVVELGRSDRATRRAPSRRDRSLSPNRKPASTRSVTLTAPSPTQNLAAAGDPVVNDRLSREGLWSRMPAQDGAKKRSAQPRLRQKHHTRRHRTRGALTGRPFAE